MLLMVIFSQARVFASQGVTLLWDPSTDPSVTSYNLYYGVASGDYTNVISVGNVTNATVPGLLKGVTYYFAATALDASGLESNPSNEISYSVPTNTTIISHIPDQVVAENSSTPPLHFIIGSAETGASNLTLYASCSNSVLVASTNILFGGSGSNRTVKVTPLRGQTGEADVNITVSDGIATASTTFHLSVFNGVLGLGANLTLLTKGAGKIVQYLNAQTLVVGKTYTISATPAAGQVFAGWSGATNSSDSHLTFLLTSNSVLQATFIPSPYIAIQGHYSGLFYEPGAVQQNNAGCFAVSATAGGTYSAWVQLGGNWYSCSGRLNLQCQATNTITRRNQTSLQLELLFGSGDQADQVFGRLTDGVWSSTLWGDRGVFNAKTNPAPYAGRYTVVIRGADRNPSLPNGDGFGTMWISAGGNAWMAGSLPDGLSVSRSAQISKQGLWPFFVALYSGQGLAMSWLAITNRADDDLNGLLAWTRPANAAARYYPLGFTNEFSAIGSIYAPPATRTNLILNYTNALVLFSGGNLSSDFTNQVAIGLNNRVTNLSSNWLSLNFALATGAFNGVAIDPSTGKAASFKGAVLQKMNAGYGFLFGTNQSSRVVLAP